MYGMGVLCAQCRLEGLERIRSIFSVSIPICPTKASISKVSQGWQIVQFVWEVSLMAVFAINFPRNPLHTKSCFRRRRYAASNNNMGYLLTILDIVVVGVKDSRSGIRLVLLEVRGLRVQP